MKPPKCWVLVTAKGRTIADACAIPFASAIRVAKEKIAELADKSEEVTVTVVENNPLGTKTFHTDGKGKVSSR